LQQEKFLLVQRLKAAQNTSDEEYQAALDYWKACYPQDLALPLLMIDAFTLKKQYARAIDSIDQLDKMIGGDPFLNVQRSYQYILMKEPAKAEKAANAAIAADPTIAQAYDCLLTISLDRKDHAETARYLAAAEKALHVSLSKVVDDSEVYDDFRKSSAFKEWQAGKNKVSR
jgi:hypothetical protein